MQASCRTAMSWMRAMLSHTVHGIGGCLPELLSSEMGPGSPDLSSGDCSVFEHVQEEAALPFHRVLWASFCLPLTVEPCLCRRVVLLYELMEGRADGFTAWPGSRENQPAHERVDAQAALQALVDGQEWAKASRCIQSCILAPEILVKHVIRCLGIAIVQL